MVAATKGRHSRMAIRTRGWLCTAVILLLQVIGLRGGKAVDTHCHGEVLALASALTLKRAIQAVGISCSHHILSVMASSPHQEFHINIGK